nr:hypothetical protein [Tanacetum cinerariifolium]
MTPDSVQAMIDQALLQNSNNGDGSHSSHEDNRRNVQTTRPCFYADFMKCQPLNFKGTEGMFVANETEKIDKYISGLPNNIYRSVKSSKPKTLDETIELANDFMDQKLRTYVECQTNKRKANDLSRKPWTSTTTRQEAECRQGSAQEENTDKYCLQGEIKKLEIELWNLKFVANETEKIDNYISGLTDNIYRSAKSSKPKTLDETIELANDFMDQKLRTYAERQTNNKRKADNSSKNNHDHKKHPSKRKNVTKVYNMGSGEKKPYGKSVVSLSDASTNKALQVAKDPPCLQSLLNGKHECLAPIHRAITKLVYLVEARHHLNLIFILKHDSPRRIDDGVVMLVLEACGIPLRFGEVQLSLVALNPKLKVFYVLSDNQMSGLLVNGCSKNLFVFRWEVIQVTLKV